jgi:hypothetical protein
VCLETVEKQGGGRISFIIVDGYNLIGVHHRDLEVRRSLLIDLLVRYRRKKGHQITVVFDGWKDGRGVETSSMSGGVRIIYSRLGEKADSVIRRIVSTERHEWVVVSSDREIASHAWSMNSVPVPSEEFLSLLEAGDTEGSGDAGGQEQEEEEDDGERQSARKGSSHKQSKKEKALQRVLGRL